jgi:hypothetical protein
MVLEFLRLRDRADRPFEDSLPYAALSRFSSGTSHLAVKHIATRVAVANPVPDHLPFDMLGMNVIPGVLYIFPAGSQTDDTKLTAQDISLMLARGDIK